MQYIIIAGGEEMKEKTITIRIDESLHKDIKIHIAQESISLKDYLVKLIEEDLHGKMGKK